MPTCFVIQPFDQGQFDKRYADVYAPAIRSAELDPYRVDHDPAVTVPIEDIKRGIRESALCLADITVDNPNVWFELGFAIASGKNVVLVCSEARTSAFPFDVQNLTITRYKTESSSDFEVLSNKIVARLKALLSSTASLQRIIESTELAPVEGLNQQEMAVIVSLAGSLQYPHDHTNPLALRQEVENSGFTKMAAIIGIKSLLTKGLIEGTEFQGEDFDESYIGYSLTEKGWNWIMNNQDKFKMVKNIDLRPKVDEMPF
jgi:hypothetical protein